MKSYRIAYDKNEILVPMSQVLTIQNGYIGTVDNKALFECLVTFRDPTIESVGLRSNEWIKVDVI
jgi:hypothetical protein